MPENVYIGASCQGNGQIGAVAGISVYFGKNDCRNHTRPLPAIGPSDNINLRNTNQRATLEAIQQAIRQLALPRYFPQELNGTFKPTAVIWTRSRYAIDSLTKWAYTWVARDWLNSKGEPVLNRDLISETLLLMLMSPYHISMCHLDPNMGCEGYERAQRKANLTAKRRFRKLF